MGLNLDQILYSGSSIAIKETGNGYELAIDSNGYITVNQGTSPWVVSASDLDIRDLVYTSDSVTAHQGGTWDINSVTSITNDVNIADGGNSITVDDGGVSLTVDASDLDIRDLTSASDSVEIKTAGGQALAIDGSGYLTVNQGTSPWVVSATDLDIRDLTHVSDSVKIGDGTDFLAVNTDGSINVQTFTGGFSTWKVSDEDVTSTESQLVSTPLSGRLKIIVQNLGASDVYLSHQTGVSNSNGLLVPKNGSFEAELDDGADLYAIVGAGTSDVRITEFAA